MQELKQTPFLNYLIILFTHTFTGLLYWGLASPLFHDHIQGLREGIIADVTNGLIGASISIPICLLVSIYSRRMMWIPLLQSWCWTICVCAFLVLLHLLGVWATWIGMWDARDSTLAGGLAVVFIVMGIVLPIIASVYGIIWWINKRHKKAAENMENIGRELEDV